MAQGCDPATEYKAFSGSTETVHAVYRMQRELKCTM